MPDSPEDPLAAVQRETDCILPARDQARDYLAQLKKQDPPFPALWIGILDQAIEYHVPIEAAVRLRNVELAAWAARGLIEMQVWARYIATSDENRQNVENNLHLDQIEILDGFAACTPRGDIAPDTRATIRHARKDAVDLAGQPQPARITTAQMAKQLGMEAAYFPRNRFLSKLVHPSAYLLVRRAEGSGLEEFLPAVASEGLLAFSEVWKSILALFQDRLAEL